jgi:hypothetical protein
MNKSCVARVASILLLATAGCTTIDEHVRVSDWPELTVFEHEVPYKEMYERCNKYVGALMTPLGCTEFNFSRREAHVWVTPGFMMNTVLEHERLHAAGYDHVGSDEMAQLWHNWQAQHPAANTQSGVAASGLLP